MLNEIKNDEIKAIPQEKYDLLVWTDHEKLFRERNASRSKILAEIIVPFTIAVQVKFRRSLLGTFLNDFNEDQWQNEFINTNKLSIADTTIKNFDYVELDKFGYNNNLFDKVIKYLNNAVTETEQIDCSFFYQRATHLRLDDYDVNMVDDGVRNFKNLQVLVICGNWINNIHGSILPRRLKFLELYVNEITSLANLAKNAPKHIVHLGLGRNKLRNNSDLHLLGESGNFNSLKSLDLSECDIYSLLDIVAELRFLPHIESLLLQGNPCSMVMNYKDVVLSTLPNLVFLDGVEVAMSDRKLSETVRDFSNKAEFSLNCVKISGLPKPPKGEKKVKQTIHVEFVMPLFQQNLKEDLSDTELAGIANQSQKKNKTTSKSKEGSKKRKKNISSLYEKENEFNPRKINNSFQTQRKCWNSKMKFGPILLTSNENNLEAYRDTFRSRVNVRIIYLKYLPPEKKKGKKDNKSQKKKENKSYKSSKLQKSSMLEESKKLGKEGTHVKEPVEPKETILKKITLADFYCDLRSIDWKNDLYFYWSEDPSFGKNAVEMETYLENLRKKEAEEKAKAEEMKQAKEEKTIKLDKKGKKSVNNKEREKSSVSKKTKGSIKTNKKSSKKTKPVNLITCQINFGVSRLGQSYASGDSNEIEKEKKKTKMKNVNKD